jgi:hypothetical protein
MRLARRKISSKQCGDLQRFIGIDISAKIVAGRITRSSDIARGLQKASRMAMPAYRRAQPSVAASIAVAAPRRG